MLPFRRGWSPGVFILALLRHDFSRALTRFAFEQHAGCSMQFLKLLRILCVELSAAS